MRLVGPHPAHTGPGLDPTWLHDATVVAAQGRQIARDGIAYLVDGLIPAYGMVGFLVAYAKVGKSTWGQALASSVATGSPFLDRGVQQRRVLMVAAEDPPEYVAWQARHLAVPEGGMTFYRAPLVLTDDNLQRLAYTVQQGQYGLVLIASWSAVVVGLLQGENDNAGAAAVVERVKIVARTTHIPWLIDAHAGKGEDQDANADPVRALRGASAAAASADYLLSLRYADGPFGTKRRLSGRGRFVSVAPLILDYDDTTGRYVVVDEATELADQTWDQMKQTGAIDTTPRSVHEMARICFSVARPTGTHRRHMQAALVGRPVERADLMARGTVVIRYRLVE